MSPTPVRCSAIVDPANGAAELALRQDEIPAHYRGPTITTPLWRVTVWGQPPHAWERVWLIGAKDDNTAATEGIRRFVAEAERPLRLVL